MRGDGKVYIKGLCWFQAWRDVANGHDATDNLVETKTVLYMSSK